MENLEQAVVDLASATARDVSSIYAEIDAICQGLVTVAKATDEVILKVSSAGASDISMLDARLLRLEERIAVLEEKLNGTK